MSAKIASVPNDAASRIRDPNVSTTVGGTKGAKEAHEAKQKEDAKKVGKDFEAILVRQILNTAKVAGKSGYADMAIESLASAVTAGGGMGLSRAIEDSLLPHHTAPAKLASEKVGAAGITANTGKTGH